MFAFRFVRKVLFPKDHLSILLGVTVKCFLAEHHVQKEPVVTPNINDSSYVLTGLDLMIQWMLICVTVERWNAQIMSSTYITRCARENYTVKNSR